EYREFPLYEEGFYQVQSIYFKNVMAMIPPAQKDVETSSVFSAFVIAVVARIIGHEKDFDRREPQQRELIFVKSLLGAQQYAYMMLEFFCMEGDKCNILNEEAVQIAVKDITGNKLSTVVKVRKTSWIEETLFSITMSRLIRPQSTKSDNGTDGQSSSLPYFDVHGRRSKPFTSAADITLTQQRFDNTSTLFSHVSVSGSIRTVEAAASVSLRMLLEGKSPAEAIRAPAAMYDPRNGKFYCEYDKKFLQLLYVKHNIVCEEMKTDDKHMREREVMALKLKSTNEGTLDKVMQTALTRDPTENNYPVGI
ncbi:hypothetical protein GCK32_012235, partial [Trichostrongylus colubriformis]